MEALALRTTPSPGMLVKVHLRHLIIRHYWVLLVLALLIVAYQFTAIIDPEWSDSIDAMRPFIDGAVGMPYSLFFVLFAGFWSIRAWTDLPTGGRSVYSSYPVDHYKHYAIRIAAGAVVIMSILVAGWILGALICEIAAPGRSTLTQEAYSGWGFLVTFIGFFNVYLYGSIFAILFKRPENWFVGLPVGYETLWGLLRLLDMKGVSNVLHWPVLGPVGIANGFALTPMILPGDGSPFIPGLHVVLLWTAILSAGVYAASRVHSDN